LASANGEIPKEFHVRRELFQVLKPRVGERDLAIKSPGRLRTCGVIKDPEFIETR
jgi:hypothetical protein